jgi:hypothetical protein
MDAGALLGKETDAVSREATDREVQHALPLATEEQLVRELATRLVSERLEATPHSSLTAVLAVQPSLPGAAGAMVRLEPGRRISFSVRQLVKLPTGGTVELDIPITAHLEVD